MVQPQGGVDKDWSLDCFELCLLKPLSLYIPIICTQTSSYFCFLSDIDSKHYYSWEVISMWQNNDTMVTEHLPTNSLCSLMIKASKDCPCVSSNKLQRCEIALLSSIFENIFSVLWRSQLQLCILPYSE